MRHLHEKYLWVVLPSTDTTVVQWNTIAYNLL